MAKAKHELAKNKKQALEQRADPPPIELKSDAFGPEEQKKVVKMVVQDIASAEIDMAGWIDKKSEDTKHYLGAKPSELEDLDKEDWQGDRNLGLCASVCDAYQATLLQTCWNPETIRFKHTEVGSPQNKQNLETVAKWMVDRSEMDYFPEIDDYIHNRITLGVSFAEVHWKVWHEWIDKRILNVSTNKYKIKTEKKRFEKAELTNIANPEDLMFVDFGKNLQSLPWVIHVWHKYASEIWEDRKKEIYKNIDEKWIDEMRTIKYPKNTKIEEARTDELGEAGYDNIDDLRDHPVDVYVWYGWYEKDGKREKYRFAIEPQTQTFLSGKPLRKITRNGKYPFTGGPLIRIPGHVRGKSIPALIAPIVNAFNNIYNQKSDFQYVTNCPFGFYNPAISEGYTQQEFKIKPMTLFPVDGNPTDNVYVPNLARSMAWAVEDINILMELLERLTGAASFFMTNRQGVSGTATRDIMIQEKSETRFGQWVMRLNYDICELINVSIGLYQDWAPPKLGDRILNDEGQQVIRNFSIDAIRGGFSAIMSPDFLSGSKTLEKQVALWGFENLVNTIWLDPRINPTGNYNLVADTARKVMGEQDVERYLGKRPKVLQGSSDEVEQEWGRFMNGEDFDPIAGEDPAEHFMGHMKQHDEKYYKLDEEYRPIFDRHLMKSSINFVNYLKKIQNEQASNMMAMGMIGQGQGGPGIQPGVPVMQPGQQAQSNVQAGGPVGGQQI